MVQKRASRFTATVRWMDSPGFSRKGLELTTPALFTGISRKALLNSYSSSRMPCLQGKPSEGRSRRLFLLGSFTTCFNHFLDQCNKLVGSISY
ncbi:hypothetical protein, partial [Candidatus Solincola sp.]